MLRVLCNRFGYLFLVDKTCFYSFVPSTRTTQTKHTHCTTQLLSINCNERQSVGLMWSWHVGQLSILKAFRKWPPYHQGRNELPSLHDPLSQSPLISGTDHRGGFVVQINSEIKTCLSRTLPSWLKYFRVTSRRMWNVRDHVRVGFFFFSSGKILKNLTGFIGAKTWAIRPRYLSSQHVGVCWK